MIAAALLLAATPAPTGVLMLDADRPLIEVRVGETVLRLRVDLDQRDVAELSAAAAARLAVAWRDGFDAVIGPVELKGRQASVIARIDGRAVPLILSTHAPSGGGDDSRPPCGPTEAGPRSPPSGRWTPAFAGAHCPDGAISPVLLPYAEVRFFRRAGGVRATYPVEVDEGDGLTIRQGGVAVQLSLAAPDSSASRAAGALLADAHDGRYAGPYRPLALAFGVARPVRPVRFTRPPVLLGLTVPTLLVRSDYGGTLAMPEDRAQPGDIVVQQRAGGRTWPLVTLGRDRLDRCGEIVWRAAPPTLALACDP